MTSDVYRYAIEIVDACWLVFVAVWVVASLFTKKTVRRQSGVARALSTALLVLAVIVYGKWGDVRPLLPHTPATAIAAAVLCVCGLAFTVWARLTLGRNWSGRVTLKEDHELIERGPYRIVRHPIYTGIVTMGLAAALLNGNAGSFAGWLLLVAGLSIKMHQEETLLLGHFGPAYEAYRKRAKRLIPFVY